MRSASLGRVVRKLVRSAREASAGATVEVKPPKVGQRRVREASSGANCCSAMPGATDSSGALGYVLSFSFSPPVDVQHVYHTNGTCARTVSLSLDRRIRARREREKERERQREYGRRSNGLRSGLPSFIFPADPSLAIRSVSLLSALDPPSHARACE